MRGGPLFLVRGSLLFESLEFTPCHSHLHSTDLGYIWKKLDRFGWLVHHCGRMYRSRPCKLLGYVLLGACYKMCVIVARIRRDMLWTDTTGYSNVGMPLSCSSKNPGTNHYLIEVKQISCHDGQCHSLCSLANTALPIIMASFEFIGTVLNVHRCFKAVQQQRRCGRRLDDSFMAFMLRESVSMAICLEQSSSRYCNFQVSYISGEPRAFF